MTDYTNILFLRIDASKNIFKDNKQFQDMGGLKTMGSATGKPMVLVMSVWDDVSGNQPLAVLDIPYTNNSVGLRQHAMARWRAIPPRT